MERDEAAEPGKQGDQPGIESPAPGSSGGDDAAGAHAAGTGLGALAGGAAGAVAGSAAGPIGAAAGAAVGALGGALVGRAITETIDPQHEDQYWREHYADRPYVEAGTGYAAYQPAYRFGWESYQRYGREFRSFDEADAALAREWEEELRAASGWPWSRARSAARDAWDRLARAHQPGRDAGA